MAAPSPRKKLKTEATCSICLDFFTDPVLIDCGHNFCEACIVKCWGESSTNAVCPQCRESVQQRDLRPNRQLANMVAIAKELSGQAEQEIGGWRLCKRHQEPLKLFCKDDEAPICMVCDCSKEHRAHNVIPVQEAAQEYKGQICIFLEILKKGKERILACKADTEKKSQDLLIRTEAEKQKAVAEFRQLHQFLEEQETLLLAQMEEVVKEIVNKSDEHVAKLSEELSSLDSVIQEIEEKCQQSASELLLDLRSTFKRCKEKEIFENPMAFSPALKWRIWDFCDINPFLQRVMKQFKDTLSSGFQLKEANVTLDPDTAHPKLIMSEDHKCVMRGDEWQDLPNNPERFNKRCLVLGCEGFTAGRHFWEVSVGSEEQWAVGVARQSVRRKRKIIFSPREGIWAVGKWAGRYRATNRPYLIPLSLHWEPKRIRVSLNYAGGRVSFFDADTTALLYVFSGASFAGEILHPLIWVRKKAHLKLSPRPTLSLAASACHILPATDSSCWLAASSGLPPQFLLAAGRPPHSSGPEEYQRQGKKQGGGREEVGRLEEATSRQAGRKMERGKSGLACGDSAMAAPRLRKKFKHEATCSVCLEFFRDPVILVCGHNFCRDCIAQCWQNSSAEAAACPQCRESFQPSDFRPNRQLANFVAITQEFSGQVRREAGAGRGCERHQEPLKLFCKDDQAPICVVCDRSKEHRAHDVVPVEEAAQEYKDYSTAGCVFGEEKIWLHHIDQIYSFLEMLRKEREKILSYKVDTEKESQDLLTLTEAEKQKSVAEFRQLHRFLEEQEKVLLAQMEAVEEEIGKKKDEHMAKLSEELCSLENIMQEIEEKCQQSASQLLQNVKGTLQRCKERKTFKNPTAFPPVLKWRIWDLCDINPFLEGVMKQFKDTLSAFQLQEANITLDPDTAHPALILSGNKKSVRGGNKDQDLPDNPERFDEWEFVLGCEGFTAGRHCWEVSVGSEEAWSLGVARKSMKRKGGLECSPEEGIWDIGKWSGEYRANIPDNVLTLSLSEEPKKIRVSLNCAGGRLSFFDADSATLLYLLRSLIPWRDSPALLLCVWRRPFDSLTLRQPRSGDRVT
ncbi:uncharacterized protein LOC128343942 [Hemicordylus capensis]|uniref:uncharacterized protein LOC128343942 n=1 Tax=Hemicordylus capensis TaxID=884348 RepID=UPI002303EA41|nr:uncharacterized protein LOC128343942 [Hemicordylus capensis]